MFSVKTEKEFTIGAIKPTSIILGQSEAILQEIAKSGLSVLDKRVVSLSSEQALRIYGKGANLQDLISHSVSGDWLFFLAEGSAAMERLRVLMGTTKLADRPPRGLRGKFGVDVTRNAIHAVKDEKEYYDHRLQFFPDIQTTQGERESMTFCPKGKKIGCHGIIKNNNEDGSISKFSVYRNGQFPDPLYREYLVLHFIAELGISPKPLGYSTENLGIDELLMERIEGVHFGDLSEERKEFFLPKIAERLKALHVETVVEGVFESIGITRTGDYADCFQDNIETLEFFARKFDYQEAINFLRNTRNQLLPLFTGTYRFGSKKFSLVHFDISDGNTIISRKGPVFLDWGSAHLNDPAWDVSRAIVKLTGGSERLVFTFLKSYGANDEMLRRVFAYLPLAYLSIAIGRSGKKEDLPRRASLRSLNRGDLFKLAVLQFRKITNI